MKNQTFDELPKPEDALLLEYHFDYQNAKPNRFANRNGSQKLTVVVLDNVDRVFITPDLNQ